ncbi:class F sortase [Dictyobacter arantiisoli]|uniref:Class F sortase n=1 Tax=Dictyobacter arantiisoli TaxID=2014874 RepID=A0A5A5TKI8_9CHLR|nr:class F sortase [Dictyobacter arantiisoli]GCF11748.1 hypothetical protein KDI_53120 [Dictyobacter arantiisoli]
MVHPQIIFTPVAEQKTVHAHTHDTSDQISTDFDRTSAQLTLASTAVAPASKAKIGSRKPTPTVNPALLALHTDTGSRLQIPALGIDAPIETVGIRPDGRMDVPLLHAWDGVGWYENGVRPGSIGSAVIDGYRNRADGTPAIFGSLGKLHNGDLILVVNADGSELHFYVNSLQTYLPNAAPRAQIFGAADGAYLNLINCDQDQHPAAPQTKQLLVVHAQLH